MTAKRAKQHEQETSKAVRLLSLDEIESLRCEMKAASQWMKNELKRRRLQLAESSAHDSFAPPDSQ